MTYLQDMPDFSLIKKVLIIKLRHLGDVVLSTAVVHVLKTRYPHLEIDLLINEEGAELLQGHEAINEVILYHRKKAKSNVISKIVVESALIFKVRRKRYDLVVNLTEGDRGNLLAIISKAPFKVGQAGSKGERFLSHLYKRASSHRHNVERDLDALRRLGIYPQETEKKLLLAYNEKGRCDVELFLKKHQIGPFYVLHPVSRWMYKTPQPEKFIELIECLDKPVLLTGLEEAFIQTVLKGTSKAYYYPTHGSLQQLIAVIDASSGLITVDSLPLHISSFLKKPTVCLFGPTSELDWGPWQNPRARVVTYNKPCRACYQDGCGGGRLSECLEQIAVSDLTAACRAVFQEVS